jgi:hypothetical protein
MNLLYVDLDGRVCSGRLTPDESAGGDGAPALVSRTGALLSPRAVVALLAPSRPTEDQRFLLWQAVSAGYRVEAA